ncbi:branched-chain amino acid ABC transporter permease [Phaeobacter sp. J2-8]|uniref:branched-chain amino acid ABC transporter permease n=1 Tax=Phaeobacter sp. J2-8 TaxID=2931394 RepID=UPI001FD0A442|nr:branched-chain amino acid ABC transporter permease [Phaeobacter sp. J2-8]MCJ7872297.1 branched-chain amino acid ABC transporter permease [Phaeobacter sp. J2-8]
MSDLLQLIISGLMVGSIYGLIGIGFTTIYNVTGIVNFAQGDLAMIGAILAITFYGLSLPLALAILLSVICVGVLAAIIERLAIRPLGNSVMRGIIVTIGVGSILQGVAISGWGTQAYSLPAFTSGGPIPVLGATILPQTFWILGTTVVLMVGLYLFFTRSYLGKAFRACAINSFAAQIIGIRLNNIRVLGFVLSGFFGAIAGIIVAPIALTQFDSGVAIGIKGFVACIIGGFGNPIGAALGGLILGIIEALSSGYLSSGFKNAIAFVMLIGFLVWKPTGILGELEK